MLVNRGETLLQAETEWRMPLRAQDYNQSPLTTQEWSALKQSVLYAGDTVTRSRYRSKPFKDAQLLLSRLNQPYADVFRLRHPTTTTNLLPGQLVLHQAMCRYEKIFWEWSADQWREVLCPNPIVFRQKHGKWQNTRTTLLDTAYLLREVTDLREAHVTQEAVICANIYFGSQRMHTQCQRLFEALTKLGYEDGKQSFSYLRHGLSLLFLFQCSPRLEPLSDDLFEQVGNQGLSYLRQAILKIQLGLRHLKLLPPRREDTANTSDHWSLSSEEMAKEWHEWCRAWYERNVDLTLPTRNHYASDVLAVGRWLYKHVPDVYSPEQWTEELALRFRKDLCSWTQGQYSGYKAQHILEGRESLGKPLQAQSIALHLTALRRFLTDLTKQPYAVHGAPPRRISLNFLPKEVLTVPAPIKRANDRVNP